METPHPTPTTPHEALPGVYNRWRSRVHGWISQRAPDELADAVLLVPDMLALIIRLIQDQRVPLSFRSQLVVVALYVLMPVDIVPEVVLGAFGLADDAVVMSVILLRLVQQASNLDPRVIRDNWAGQGDIVETLREIGDSDGELMNTKVWTRIRSLLGKRSPEPAVVKQQGE